MFLQLVIIMNIFKISKLNVWRYSIKRLVFLLGWHQILISTALDQPLNARKESKLSKEKLQLVPLAPVLIYLGSNQYMERSFGASLTSSDFSFTVNWMQLLWDSFSLEQQQCDTDLTKQSNRMLRCRDNAGTAGREWLWARRNHGHGSSSEAALEALLVSFALRNKNTDLAFWAVGLGRSSAHCPMPVLHLVHGKILIMGSVHLPHWTTHGRKHPAQPRGGAGVQAGRQRQEQQAGPPLLPLLVGEPHSARWTHCWLANAREKKNS